MSFTLQELADLIAPPPQATLSVVIEPFDTYARIATAQGLITARTTAHLPAGNGCR